MRNAIAVLLAAMSLVYCGCFLDEPMASSDASRHLSAAGLKAVRHSSATAAAPAALESADPIYAYRVNAYSSRYNMPGPQQMDFPQVFAPDAANHLVGTSQIKTISVAGMIAGFSRSGAYRPSGMPANIAGLSLSAPFESLFANVMNRLEPATGKEDLPNPFAEARKALAAEKSQPAAAASASEPAAQPDTPKADPPAASQAQNISDVSAMGISARQTAFLFLGDFDGSGILKCASAKRTGDAAFSFSDGSRSFVIFNNMAAVESQRSFAVEDMDGDGNMDVLQTSRNAMFGHVFLGDGSGNLSYANYFLSMFEPTIALPGPMGSGGRELLTVNLRTGVYVAYEARGIYLPYRQGVLGFIPDYVGRMVQLATGTDYIAASRTGEVAHLFQWLNLSGLTESDETLPLQPAISVSLDQQSEGGTSSLRAYQIGSYASVVLTNNFGKAFNVANLHITPQIFLVVGDIGRQGSLDVGIAFVAPTASIR